MKMINERQKEFNGEKEELMARIDQFKKEIHKLKEKNKYESI